MLDHLNNFCERHGERLSSKTLRCAVIRVMEEEEEYEQNNFNNFTTDNSFRSIVAMNVQNKDTNISYERRLTSGILAETIKIFKGCTIQSTINDSGYYESDEQFDEINNSKEQVDTRNWLRNNSAEQVDKINYYEEQVDARNWLRNDSTEQIDQINYSDKQVDAMSDSKKLVVTRSDQKSDPNSDPKVATHTTNGKFYTNIIDQPNHPSCHWTD